MEINEILNTLPRKEREKLDYAFEEHISVYVPLDNGTKFIGVYADAIPTLKPVLVAGHWSYGEILK